MKPFAAIALIFFALSIFSVAAQETQSSPAESWEMQALSKIIPGTVQGLVDYDPTTGTATGTNGV